MQQRLVVVCREIESAVITVLEPLEQRVREIDGEVEPFPTPVDLH